MFLTRAAVRNPVMVLMVCIAVTVLSQIGLQRLPRDLFPQITIPVIHVQTTYSGASTETMERTVTYPLEQAVTRVAGVTQILSTTRQGSSSIQVWFDWGANLDVGRDRGHPERAAGAPEPADRRGRSRSSSSSTSPTSRSSRWSSAAAGWTPGSCTTSRTTRSSRSSSGSRACRPRS